MKKIIHAIVTSTTLCLLLSTIQLRAQDQTDAGNREQIKADSLQAVEAQKTLDEQRMAQAKSESKETKEKAKEAQRVEADANAAAREAKNALKAEKKAQKARKAADKQAKKAEAARAKSNQN